MQRKNLLMVFGSGYESILNSVRSCWNNLHGHYSYYEQMHVVSDVFDSWSSTLKYMSDS